MPEEIVVFGDCQAQSLFAVLSSASELTSNYRFKLQFVGEQQLCWDRWRQEAEGAVCVFVQEIPQSAIYLANHRLLKRRPRIIKFPSLGFPSLWPFSTAFGGSDLRADKIRALTGGRGLHTDALLGALRLIRDRTRRLRSYLILDGITPEATKLILRRNSRRLHEFDTHRLRSMDERLESNLGRYILHNFRNRRLFHTIRHPAVELVEVVASELLQKVGGDNSFRITRNRNDPENYQIPIHPVIAKDLDLQWIKAETTYQVYGDWLSIKEYTWRYMEVYG